MSKVIDEPVKVKETEQVPESKKSEESTDNIIESGESTAPPLPSIPPPSPVMVFAESAMSNITNDMVSSEPIVPLPSIPLDDSIVENVNIIATTASNLSDVNIPPPLSSYSQTMVSENQVNENVVDQTEVSENVVVAQLSQSVSETSAPIIQEIAALPEKVGEVAQQVVEEVKELIENVVTPPTPEPINQEQAISEEVQEIQKEEIIQEPTLPEPIIDEEEIKLEATTEIILEEKQEIPATESNVEESKPEIDVQPVKDVIEQVLEEAADVVSQKTEESNANNPITLSQIVKDAADKIESQLDESLPPPPSPGSITDDVIVDNSKLPEPELQSSPLPQASLDTLPSPISPNDDELPAPPQEIIESTTNGDVNEEHIKPEVVEVVSDKVNNSINSKTKNLPLTQYKNFGIFIQKKIP